MIQKIAFFALLGSVAITCSGVMLNHHVMSLNGGVMPVVATSDAERTIVVQTIAEEQKGGAVYHSLATPATRWTWAADCITLYSHDPDASGKIIATKHFLSPGDILLAIGFRGISAALMICLAMTLFIFTAKGLGDARANG